MDKVKMHARSVNLPFAEATINAVLPNVFCAFKLAPFRMSDLVVTFSPLKKKHTHIFDKYLRILVE